jgi:hypothetical protein
VTRCGFLRRGRCERDCRARRQRSLTPTFAITLHLHGPRNTNQCVNSSLRTLLASIGPPQQRADPSRPHDELHTPSSPAREGRFPPAHCLRPPIGCCAPRSHCQPEQSPEDCGAHWTDGMHLHAQRPDLELQANNNRPSSSRPCPSSFLSSSSTRPPWPSSFSRPSSISCRNTSSPTASACSRLVSSSASYREGTSTEEDCVQLVGLCS